MKNLANCLRELSTCRQAIVDSMYHTGAVRKAQDKATQQKKDLFLVSNCNFTWDQF